MTTDGLNACYSVHRSGVYGSSIMYVMQVTGKK